MTIRSPEPNAEAPTDQEAPTSIPAGPASTTGPRRVKRTAAIAGSLVVGGGALLGLLGPLSASAASPSSDPSALASSAPAASQTPSTTGAAHEGGYGPGGPGGPGMAGHTEAVSDTSVAAKAIGISEADLLTAIQSGKTIADVAKANNVDPQTVIDALVQDGLDELAAAVKAGTITQAQADADKANVSRRATDQVNGTLRGGPGGPGAMGGRHGWAMPGAASGSGAGTTGG